MTVLDRYLCMKNDNMAFIINNNEEMIILDNIMEELMGSGNYRHYGITTDDYLSGKYEYPTLVWHNADECIFSHQTFANMRNEEYYKDLIANSISIDKFVNYEEYPEYFI